MKIANNITHFFSVNSVNVLNITTLQALQFSDKDLLKIQNSNTTVTKDLLIFNSDDNIDIKKTILFTLKNRETEIKDFKKSVNLFLDKLEKCYNVDDLLALNNIKFSDKFNFKIVKKWYSRKTKFSVKLKDGYRVLDIIVYKDHEYQELESHLLCYYNDMCNNSKFINKFQDIISKEEESIRTQDEKLVDIYKDLKAFNLYTNNKRIKRADKELKAVFNKRLEIEHLD